MENIYLGIDGGATHARGVAISTSGHILSRAEGEGLNAHHFGWDTCVRRLEPLVRKLLPKVYNPEDVYLSAGLATLDGPATEEQYAALSTPLILRKNMHLQSDASVALSGGTLGAPGLCVIAGTGSMLLLRDPDGIEHVSGGWGFALHDSMSGYQLAMDGLQAAVNAWDGVGPKTALCEAATRFFEVHEPREILLKLYSVPYEVANLAKFSQQVLLLADQDPVAQGIVDRHLNALVRQAHALLMRFPGVTQVCLYGGIFEHHPDLARKFKTRLLERCGALQVHWPLLPPEIGAVIQHMQMLHQWTPEILAQLQAEGEFSHESL